MSHYCVSSISCNCHSYNLAVQLVYCTSQNIYVASLCVNIHVASLCVSSIYALSVISPIHLSPLYVIYVVFTCNNAERNTRSAVTPQALGGPLQCVPLSTPQSLQGAVIISRLAAYWMTERRGGIHNHILCILYPGPWDHDLIADTGGRENLQHRRAGGWERGQREETTGFERLIILAIVFFLFQCKCLKEFLHHFLQVIFNWLTD